jgi:hypothetical protein
MHWLIALIVCLAAAAVNVAFYVTTGSAFSLGCAILTGGLAVFNLIKAVQAR